LFLFVFEGTCAARERDWFTCRKVKKKKINGGYFNQYNAVSGMDCFFFFFSPIQCCANVIFFFFFNGVFYLFIDSFFLKFLDIWVGGFFWVVLTIDPILMFGCTKKKK